MEIPGEDDWKSAILEDLDVAWAYRRFRGKSFEEAVELFDEDALGCSESLSYVPPRVFAFYIRVFIAYLMSDAAKGDPDAANSFISLIGLKAEHDPETIRAAWSIIEPALRHLAEHQDDYEADWSTYGSFRVRVREIERRGLPVSINTDFSELAAKHLTLSELSPISPLRVSFPAAVQIFRRSGLEQIDFSSKRGDIDRILGPPTAEGELFGVESDLNLTRCRYDRPGHSLRFEFEGESAVAMTFLPTKYLEQLGYRTTPGRRSPGTDGLLGVLDRIKRLFRRD